MCPGQICVLAHYRSLFCPLTVAQKAWSPGTMVSSPPQRPPDCDNLGYVKAANSGMAIHKETSNVQWLLSGVHKPDGSGPDGIHYMTHHDPALRLAGHRDFHSRRLFI